MIGRNLGRYRIVGEIGRGGMGVVYRATQTTLDRTVAIKMLSPHLADSGEHLARFRREAEVLARLQHECIVHIYDVEEVEGSFCIVMEHVAGPSLGEVLQREGKLGEGRVREVAVQLASGLEAAHRKGIVHRDLKPDNILFTPEGRPKITDFGIARIAGDDAVARTRTGILMGTPYYMSPEQARGGTVTGASDQYALGVLLFQMLSGRVPFEGSDPISVAIKHMQEAPPSLREAVPGIHPGLASVVEKAMAKDPAERFASAGEMARSLRVLELEGSPADEPWCPGPAESGGPRCPGCGGGVRVEFVTCPKCGYSLLGSGDVPVAREVPSGVSFLSRMGSLIPSFPSMPSMPSMGGERLAREMRRWTQPSGPWNVPPLLWFGVVLVTVGLALGLARILLVEGSLFRSDDLARTPPPVQEPSAPLSDPTRSGAPGGPVPWPGIITTRQPSPSPSSQPIPSVEELIPPRPGVSEPPEGTPEAPGTPTTPETEPVREEAGDPRAPTVARDSAELKRLEPEPELESFFDEARARAELRDVVERQRRATESGDRALFLQDLCPELGSLHAPFLAELHQVFSQIRSEVSNLDVEFVDSEMAVVDFTARISGIRRGERTWQVIQNSHVHWLVERRDQRWIVTDAWNEPLEEEEA